jgi:hypothetical protein
MRLLAVLVAAAAVGCSALLGIHDIEEPNDGGRPADGTTSDAARMEAGGDGAFDGGAPEGAACPGTSLPDRPSASDPSDGGDVPALVLAFDTLDLDPSHDIGLDLDHTDTCPGPESCQVPSNSLRDATCDNPDGADPVLNRVTALVGSVYCLNSPATVLAYENWVLRISGYNGQPNDTQVTVELYVSTGTPPIGDAGENVAPAFDGGDTWQIWDQSLVPEAGALSRYIDPAAYVAGGVLVTQPNVLGVAGGGVPLLARPPPAALRCDAGAPGNGAPLVLYMQGFVLAGRLTPGAGGFSLQCGRWGGRVAMNGPYGLLRSLGQLGFCNGTTLLCALTDIASSPASDGKNAPCDALSFGAAFTASPASLGSVSSVQLGPDCPGEDAGNAAACAIDGG